jgi:two-component system sensor histidine kinase CreC
MTLRLRIFLALAAATLLSALVTGVFAVAVDGQSIGFFARLVSVAPKALLLASVLLPVAAGAAAIAGRRIARSVEELADAASRIAEGERSVRLPRARGGEALRIGRALATLRREVEGQPYAAAFLRDAWHDLKTPLAAIRATVEVLEDGALEDRDTAHRFLTNLSRSAGELDRMLADLVTLARMQTAALAPERPIAMSSVVTSAIARVMPLAAARGVALEAGGSAAPPSKARLHGDRAALERAFGNLLENAIDATPGGRVEVWVGTGARGAIVIDVQNEPAAVPGPVRGRLFERAMTSREGRGSGLGLAIVRAAVEAHGGRVRFVEMGPPRVRVRVELPGSC